MLRQQDHTTDMFVLTICASQRDPSVTKRLISAQPERHNHSSESHLCTHNVCFEVREITPSKLNIERHLGPAPVCNVNVPLKCLR